jgi:hypothetical protein
MNYQHYTTVGSLDPATGQNIFWRGWCFCFILLEINNVDDEKNVQFIRVFLKNTP